MTSTRAKSLLKAIEAVEKLQDDIAYQLAKGNDFVEGYPLLEALARVTNLIDRSYPEDVGDDGYEQYELDFGDGANTEEPFTHLGFDHEESEEEER